ncbi:hypothetical protein F2P81_014589 [Scophthalmus maximus]|uniref:Uncharacterized protein n=1 Tax=Scophthalmus maximus TaxID=52904 RepID=A0A6A4SIF5_SCOMX|nr:hypothetical protein F2P81_014589 [Scophthalmus maximus]
MRTEPTRPISPPQHDRGICVKIRSSGVKNHAVVQVTLSQMIQTTCQCKKPKPSLKKIVEQRCNLLCRVQTSQALKSEFPLWFQAEEPQLRVPSDGTLHDVVID